MSVALMVRYISSEADSDSPLHESSPSRFVVLSRRSAHHCRRTIPGSSVSPRFPQLLRHAIYFHINLGANHITTTGVTRS